MSLTLAWQGNCEHIVVFNEVRMLHGDDAKDKNAYPVLAFQSKIRRRKCRLCDIYPAKWVTYNDKLSIENPCFYCDHCYHPFHYSAEGKLLCVDVLPLFAVSDAACQVQRLHGVPVLSRSVSPRLS